MSTVDGAWNVTIKSPIGPQSATLTLATVDGALTGSQSGQGQTSVITDAKLDGNKIYWVNHVTKPMKMKVEFSGIVDESGINGKVKAGVMGSFPFSAVRSPTAV
jgi:hypothetical protein